MTDRQKHRWIGWGYDTTLCEHCRVDAYDPLQVALHTEYCDELHSHYLERLDVLNMDSKLWRTLALKHSPYKNFNKVMKDSYGLVRVVPKFAGSPIYYEVVDKSKYLLFTLKYL